MNTLRSIIRMAQANPRWARIAVALDATIGLIVGLVVYFLLNLVEVPASSVFVLLFGAILAIVGIIAVGYLLFVQKFEGVSNPHFQIVRVNVVCQDHVRLERSEK